MTDRVRLTEPQHRALIAARQHAGRGEWFAFCSYPQVLDGLERRGLVRHVSIPFRGSTQHSAILTEAGRAERMRRKRAD